MKRTLLLLALLLPLLAHGATERLDYKLYFNWKFVWLTAGTATLTTTDATWQGRPTRRCSLVTETSQRIDKYFRMRDTLLCHTSQNCLPLYYRKAAAEGSRYYVDELLYKYGGGKVTVTMRELTSRGERHEKRQTFQKNVFDMLSIVVWARNHPYPTSTWRKGYTILFPLADGGGVQTARLRFQGRSTVKAEDGTRHRCLELSYIETDGGQEKEIARFFVTDDTRHTPVRIDLFLRFGTAKAFLKKLP